MDFSQPEWSQRYLDTVQTMIVALDRKGCIAMINRAGCELLGYEENELIGQSWFEACLPAPENIEVVLPVFLEAMAENIEGVEYFENEVLTKSNARKMIAWRNSYLRDKAGNLVGILSSGEDITDRINAEKALKRYIDIVDKHVLSSSTDLNGIITDVSSAFCKINGYTKNELIGKNHNILKHSEVPNSLYKELWETITSGNLWRGELKNLCKDGSDYWVDMTVEPIFNDAVEIIGYTAIRHNISDKKQIEKISVTDPLTQIYNRLKLDMVINEEINRVKRYKTTLSIIILDLDDFKEVNDSFGHQVGDYLLINIANLISENIRNTDTLGRWGGEEFMVICPEIDKEGAINLANKIRLAIKANRSSEVGQKTASVGVATYQVGESSYELFSRADAALYLAKKNGKDKVEIAPDLKN